jgi:ornithine cyclodeaminase/alanine dehydrogenase-like protein (mu-crystallin family)
MLILTRSDTEGLLGLPAVIDAVEDAFALRGRGLALAASRFHVAAGSGGAFHVVAGGLAPPEGRTSFGIKANGHFPLPDGGRQIRGAILLVDGDDGQPLALLDSRVVTGLRTAAVTAVAARRLARADARSALVVGAGRQAPGQVDALAAALPLERVSVYARDAAAADRVARHARGRGLDAEAVRDLRRAAAASDVIVTITTAGEPLLADADVPPGCFVAALGADGPGKQELDPALLGRSRVVVDVLAQAAAAGELAGALAAGAMRMEDVHAELGEVVVGVKPGRTRPDERFVFDSTGTALQDVAAGLLLVEAARAAGRGLELDLAS